MTESAEKNFPAYSHLPEQDAGEGRQPMTLIMVHAQDHLMNSLLARELSEEIIHLYQR